MPQVVFRESTGECKDLEEMKVEEKTTNKDKIKDGEFEEQKGEDKKRTR